MKTIQFLSLIVLITAVSSCCIDTHESVFGNGNVVSEERSIGDFERLKVSSGIDVFIKQGTGVSLMLEADENLLDVIKTEVVDNTLKIYTSKNVRRSRSMKVYLVYEDLNSIRVSSAGDVRGENTLQTDKLNIDLSSAGDLELDLQADEVNCEISSSGDASLTGSTRVLVADLSSAGDLHAYELIAEKCKISCSSAGDARVFASEEFDLRSSSAGSIYYKGDGNIVSVHTSSAGSIVKK
ncbi:head GIN domain-containing protein [Bacteroidota bacterium]